MHESICLTASDGRTIALPAERIVGIYPSRLGSIVAFERHAGSAWSEVVVGEECEVIVQKWNDARAAGVSCLDDWLANT
jgi:hypothetical protein